MNFDELKRKSAPELLKIAEELEIESPANLPRQQMLFHILKEKADDGEIIQGSGVLEVLPDRFGFLRSAEENYLAGPDDVYVPPEMIKKFGFLFQIITLSSLI